MGFAARTIAAVAQDVRAPLVYERDGTRHETSLGLIAAPAAWRAVAFAFAAAGLFLLFRATPTPTVRANFHAGLCFGFAACPFGGPFPLGYVAVWSLIGAQVLILPLLLRYTLLFPDDRMPTGRSHRVWPWLFAVLGPIWAVTAFTGRWTLGEAAYFATIVLGCAALLGVRTYKYRRADAIARRQSRWLVAGTYCALLPLIVSGVLLILDPRFQISSTSASWAVALVPFTLVFSVWRFNLFDVDRILSAAASYNVLAVALGAAVLVVVPRVAEAASGLVGISPATGQLALSLALAALAIPAHRRLVPRSTASSSRSATR